ncbi:MAG: ATP-binding cassette domain-containing protein [Gammaproteobacteria bacterium]|nr:ATP-binding cassette domain-containing protein [Gammaproteobacteria bacterium]
MSLVRFEEVSLEFSDQKILTQAEFAIEPGERVCLIGRNGAGKSTTLKLITGEIEPDSGNVIRQSGLVVSELAQSLPEAMNMQVREVVNSGLAGIQLLLEEYDKRSQETLDKRGLRELEELHRLIDAHGGWHIAQRIETTMTELNLPADKRMNELSGGWRRRVALAKALVQKPDLLLLDEPTNHLDIVTIKWLENTVFTYPGAVIFITHDRAFLQRLATRILEIDRGKLTSWPGNYNKYLIRKEKALEDEARENARFDKKLEQEEIWIRQGIKARRTRNEGRSRALVKMREERSKRVARDKGARMYIEEAEQSGRKVIRARKVSYRYQNEPLIENFSIKIMRGDRIGLVGNNGVGKTTLLRLLLGELEPQSGVVKHGTNLEIGYFDQLRQTLELEKSVAENVGDGCTYIKLNGKERHVVGYLKGFLFSPKRSMTPVKALSGGERNRVILAKLFTRAANLLVLDEPTNDLDMETLDVLEQKLAEFNGTLIVVSHDRQFLDNVVTSILVFEADGSIQEYVGGYSDWVRQGKELAEVDNPNMKKRSQLERGKSPEGQRPKKLGYKEQRELEQLPSDIEQLEMIVAALEEQISAANFYSQDHAEVDKVLTQLTDNQEALDKAIERWTELEERELEFRAAR